MHPISQEAKKELIEAFRVESRRYDDNFRMRNYVEIGEAVRIVESFPTSEPDTIPTEYDTGICLRFKADVANTGIATIGGKVLVLENRWIPVTEKFPKARELVLFTSSEDDWVLVGFVYYGKWYNHNGCECFPTHWQPLPKPPVT